MGWAAAVPAAALVFVADYDDAADGPRVISGPDGHHLQRVRRIGVGERIVVADGAGRWYLSEVASSADATLTVVPVGAASEEPQPAPRIAIAFAPAKSDHGTEVVHQLVEVGVDRIVPLITERSVVRWDGARGERAQERLQRVVRTAGMQCHRARLPVLEPPSTLGALVASEGVLVADRDGGAIDPVNWPPADEWCVVIGPEGGFAPEELEPLGSAPRIALGPHVLRSVTAPIAVASALAVHRSR